MAYLLQQYSLYMLARCRDYEVLAPMGRDVTQTVKAGGHVWIQEDPSDETMQHDPRCHCPAMPLAVERSLSLQWPTTTSQNPFRNPPKQNLAQR